MQKQVMERILPQFAIEGRAVSAEPYGTGHINDTMRVVTDAGRDYILQRLSPVAFKQPERVMDNVQGVLAHLRGKVTARGGDPARETLTLILTHDGRPCVMDETGCWRMYTLIHDAVGYQLPENGDIFREAGHAFGAFQTALSDYPADSLYETIPRFHDTVNRTANLARAIETDGAGRAASVQEEIAFARARFERAGTLLAGLQEGRLPLRVTHNDTKLDNVLMDRATGKGLCVIDLDTVMPGLCAYDFGDAIRFGANTAVEDEADLSKVHFSMDMFRAWTEGYLAEAGDALCAEEIRTLPLGAWMMTYEVGIRFLTDYLEGDVYFHTAYPEHNIVRARNQFALLADMERHEEEMNAFVARWIKE